MLCKRGACFSRRDSTLQSDARTAGLRILSIEEEYLIALDVQHALSALPGCQIDVDMSQNFELLMSAPTDYHVVLVDPTAIDMTRHEIAERIEQTGARVVWTSLDSPPEESDGLCHIPTVQKPFSDKSLLLALQQVLPEDQPDVARAVAALLAGSGP